jgi:hypothetical protein
MRLEALGTSMSDNKFILHILKNMTDDYGLQLAMMEKKVTDKSNPLTIDEIRNNLNLRFERLNEIRRLHFLVVNLKENVKIVVQSGIKQRIANQK